MAEHGIGPLARKASKYRLAQRGVSSRTGMREQGRMLRALSRAAESAEERALRHTRRRAARKAAKAERRKARAAQRAEWEAQAKARADAEDSERLCRIITKKCIFQSPWVPLSSVYIRFDFG